MKATAPVKTPAAANTTKTATPGVKISNVTSVPPPAAPLKKDMPAWYQNLYQHMGKIIGVILAILLFLLIMWMKPWNWFQSSSSNSGQNNSAVVQRLMAENARLQAAAQAQPQPGVNFPPQGNMEHPPVPMISGSQAKRLVYFAPAGKRPVSNEDSASFRREINQYLINLGPNSPDMLDAAGFEKAKQLVKAKYGADYTAIKQ